MKRTAVFLVCLAVVLAGCTGAGVGDAGGDAGENASGGGAGDGGAMGSEGSDSDGVANDPTATGIDPWFDLGDPGRYVFEVDQWTFTGVTTERFVYETTEVSGGTATVEFTQEMLVYEGESLTDEEPTVTTVSGPVETIEDTLFEEEYSATTVPWVLEIAQYRIVSEFDDRLEVGQRVEQTINGSEIALEVVRVGSYGGVECYVVHELVDGDLRGETCTSTAFRFPPYVVTYDETGAEDFRIELVEYERR